MLTAPCSIGPKVKLMKIQFCRILAATLLLGGGGGALPAAADPTEAPRIEGIRTEDGGVVVTVRVPAGVRKVTLESRARPGHGAWIPREVRRLDGQGGEVVFRLPPSESVALLRVRGDATEPLPLRFYAGPTEFTGPASTVPTSDVPRGGGFFAGTGQEDAATPGAGGGATRTVVESDIWKLEGDTLYFFNQYRGLQVIDLTLPDAPVVRQTLPLAASGEQMYLVTDATGQELAVLLARNGCGWSADEESRVMVIDPGAEDGIGVVATVAVPGTIVESRLVGTALYLASQGYRRTTLPPTPDRPEPVEQWESGTTITAVDLSEPRSPQTRGQFWFPGYGGVVQATDQFLFLVTTSPSDWWQSVIQIVDISAADGTMVEAGRVVPAGRVADKFKMNLADGVFTVISEVARWSASGRQLSVLETFSLQDPLAPAALGRLEVGHGEGLYATRFDGNRAYLVTFLRIDPLWVVDLSDPARPRVSGELEVPGWSTYIHPLGDRLVTVGIDNSNSWRVAVSLFDVQDPARPGLLARVPLGENSSWSEANHDEKAFAVLPDAGLILVPYQSWGEGGQASRVQLIDLEPDTLRARGVIEHSMQPRRATASGDRLFSVSGREFLSVDAADRDAPVVAASLELSWPVDRVLAVNGHLLEVAGVNAGYGAAYTPVVRVARTGTPDEALRRVALPSEFPVSGVTLVNDRLCVVQTELWPAGGTVDPTDPDARVKSRLRLSVYSLGALPDLPLAGSVEVEVEALGWGTQFRLLEPRPGLLVLASTGGYGWWGWWGRGGIGLEDALVPGLWWPGSGDARLIAFDVAGAVPVLLSDVTLEAGQGWWTGGEAFTAGGLVFLDRQGSEFLEGVLLPGQTPPKPYEITLPDGTKQLVEPEIGIWITKYYLEVVDYADPAEPTRRPPVNLPGRLLGVDAAGSLLFCSGPHWDAQWRTDGAEYLDACAYDGVSASLVASLRLPAEWPRAVAVAGGTAYVAKPLPAPATGGVIERWQLEAGGQFVKTGQAGLATAAYQIKALGTHLLTQSGAGVRVFLDAGQGGLKLVGESAAAGCFWPDLGTAITDPGIGAWIPLGDYGLMSIPLTAGP